jgi:hypothetical protein
VRERRVGGGRVGQRRVHALGVDGASWRLRNGQVLVSGRTAARRGEDAAGDRRLDHEKQTGARTSPRRNVATYSAPTTRHRRAYAIGESLEVRHFGNTAVPLPLLLRRDA